MTLAGVTLAEAAGQPFTRVFRQQWVLCETDPGELPGFRKSTLGSWGLWAGPGLDVATASDPARGWAVAVMGQAVDLEGRYVTDTVLADHLAAAGTAEALAEGLTMLAGRHAVVVTAPGVARLYLDPSGCLGAVYDPAARRVGATLFLALDRPVEPDRAFPFHELASTGAGRYAFGRTPDAHARRLLANHYLDLTDFTAHRHWPAPGCDFACPMTEDAIDERIELVVARHRAVLAALLDAPHPSMLPLSGGDDSRLLLALSNGLLDRYALVFGHRANGIGGRDVAIAQEIAAAMGVPLHVIDAVRDKTLTRPPRFARRMNQRRRLAMGLLEGGPDEARREIEVRMALPEGGAVFRGNVTDVSKAVLWRGVGIGEFLRTKGASHDPGLGVRLLMLGPPEAQRDPWCLAAYADWLATLPEGARCRALDFASIEHFRSHGQGAFFYATSRNFYQTPSADRTILEALITLPPHLRDAFHVNDRIIERTAPALTGIPFTRGTANDMRARRKSLAEVLAKGPERL